MEDTHKDSRKILLITVAAFLFAAVFAAFLFAAVLGSLNHPVVNISVNTAPQVTPTIEQLEEAVELRCLDDSIRLESNR
jgi:flagellar basal body-associated protein FliL